MGTEPLCPRCCGVFHVRASHPTHRGHPTEPGTQSSLSAFSLDDTQQVHHKYSVNTAGMKQCDVFPLCHLPANSQMAECRGLSRLTHLCPLDNCREHAVLATVQVASEVLALSPRGMVFPQQMTRGRYPPLFCNM